MSETKSFKTKFSGLNLKKGFALSKRQTSFIFKTHAERYA